MWIILLLILTLTPVPTTQSTLCDQYGESVCTEGVRNTPTGTCVPTYDGDGIGCSSCPAHTLPWATACIPIPYFPTCTDLLTCSDPASACPTSSCEYCTGSTCFAQITNATIVNATLPSPPHPSSNSSSSTPLVVQQRLVSCASSRECVANCSAPGSCPDLVLTCPQTSNCTVLCSGPGSCARLNVTCPTIEGGCSVQCTGVGSCAGGSVTCGKPACLPSCPALAAGLLPTTIGDSQYVVSSCEPGSGSSLPSPSGPLSIFSSPMECVNANTSCSGFRDDGVACSSASQCRGKGCINGACCSIAKETCCPEGKSLDSCFVCAGGDVVPDDTCVANAILSVEPSRVDPSVPVSLTFVIQGTHVASLASVTVNDVVGIISDVQLVGGDETRVTFVASFTALPARDPVSLSIKLDAWDETLTSPLDPDTILFQVTKETCTLPGTYLNRLECTPCPTGAACPGNDRVLPLAGYWNPDASSDFVNECPLPELCVGYANGTCAEGYTGVLCMECADEYHHLTPTKCAPCRDAFVNSSVLVLALVGFLIVFIVGLVLAPPWLFSALIASLLALQSAYATGIGRLDDLDKQVQSLYLNLSLVGVHLHFVRFECLPSGKESYEAMFYASLTLMAFFFIVTVLILTVLSIATGDSWGPIFAARRVRAGVFVGVFLYMPLLHLSMGALDCSYTEEGTLVLARAPEVLCYSGEHVMVSFAAWMIVFNVGIGVPVCIGAFVFSLREDYELYYTHAAFRERFDLIYTSFPSHLTRMLQFTFFVRSFILVLVGTIVQTSLVRFFVAPAVLGIEIVLWVVARPRRTLSGLAESFLSLITPFAFACLNLNSASSDPPTTATYYYLALGGWALGSVIVISLGVLSRYSKSSSVSPAHTTTTT